MNGSAPNSTTSDSGNALEVSKLVARFRGCEPLAGIDLTVPKGTVFALLGENGAGKTTLIRCLTGFLEPTSGQCRVLGLDPVTQAVEIRRRVGYVSDTPAFYEWMKVEEVVWFAEAIGQVVLNRLLMIQ